MLIKNDRLIKALLRQPVDRTPIWIMRQAGRYLPEYRKLREKAGDFLTLCKTPELACEATLQPLARFDLDAAIIFSDILTIPDAMGMGLYFQEGEGPCFEKKLLSEKDILDLPIPDPLEKLQYVFEAIALTKRDLNQRVPLIGFSGSPWTLACYMLEGHGKSDFAKAKTLLYQNPKTLSVLLEKLSESITQYLNAQIAAGADAVMLFDTWGGLLSTRDYELFSLNFMKKIVKGLTRERERQKIPVIIFTKGGGQWLEKIAESGCDAIGLDWTVDIKKAREQVGDRVALQGNLDPQVLLTNPETIRKEAQYVLDAYGKGTGHVFNLGHGITPDVPPEHLSILIDVIKEKGT